MDESWAVVAAIAGMLAVVATVIYGEIQRRLAQRQLALAQEQAELRPRLEVTFPVNQLRHLPLGDKGFAIPAYLSFEVTNVGGMAAHNVHCGLEFDPEHLEALGSGSFSSLSLPPAVPRNMQVPMRIHTHGPTWVRYTCTYDEGNPITGTVEFEIPNPKGGDRP